MSVRIISILLAMAEATWLPHPLPEPKQAEVAPPAVALATAPAEQPVPSQPVAPTEQPVPAPVRIVPAPPLGASIASQPYRIGAGDRLRINTFGEDRFSGEFLVNGDGQIVFPLFGNIPARGLTTSALAASIATRLQPDYVRDPRVTAEVISFRPVYVLGEVARPGEYPYVEGMTVYTLVAKAGGFSYRANTKVIFVRRENSVVEHKYRSGSATPVLPGDTIRIPGRYF